MSDNWIGIIPREPRFVPSEDAIAQAEAYMAEIAPEAEEISGEISAKVQFRDCGANFLGVYCPICDAELSLDWWQEQMGDEDYWDGGFELKSIDLPCGHAAPSLNHVRYDWEQGFSRFILDTMNPMREPLAPEEIARVENILGCPVKVIYQHL